MSQINHRPFTYLTKPSKNNPKGMYELHVTVALPAKQNIETFFPGITLGDGSIRHFILKVVVDQNINTPWVWQSKLKDGEFRFQASSKKETTCEVIVTSHPEANGSALPKDRLGSGRPIHALADNKPFDIIDSI